MLDDDTRKYVMDLFGKELEGEVNIMLFIDSDSKKCETCKYANELMSELAALDGRLKLTTYDMGEKPKEAKFLGIDKAPAIVLGGKKIYNLYYFGIPSDHEFTSLLEDITDVSKNRTRLQESTKEKLKGIEKNVNIKVFVTPTCPYCPMAVRIAHQFAMENSKVTAQMIDAMEFQELAQKFNVMGVPKIVINDSTSFEGAVPEGVFLSKVLEALK